MSDMSKMPTADDIATGAATDASMGGAKIPPADAATKARDTNFRLLADIPVRLSVELGSVSKKLADIMKFRDGEVVELDRQASELFDVMVNGTMVAKGEIVTIDGRFGVRIAEIVNEGVDFPAFERR